jgi:hypothetical protein
LDPRTASFGIRKRGWLDWRSRSITECRKRANQPNNVVSIQGDHEVQVGCEARIAVEDNRDPADHEVMHSGLLKRREYGLEVTARRRHGIILFDRRARDQWQD